MKSPSKQPKMTGGSSDVDSFPSPCSSKTNWMKKEEKGIKLAGQNVKRNSYYTSHMTYIYETTKLKECKS